MRNRTKIKTAIPTTSGFRNFALCTLNFAFSTRPLNKQPILPKLPTIYCLFMQNKPNFRKSQMNLSVYLEKAYENKSNWTLGENKPNQTQFVVSLCQRCLSNLFQTGHQPPPNPCLTPQFFRIYPKKCPCCSAKSILSTRIFKKLLICTCFYSIIILFYTICTKGHICRSIMEKAYNAN